MLGPPTCPLVVSFTKKRDRSEGSLGQSLRNSYCTKGQYTGREKSAGVAGQKDTHDSGLDERSASPQSGHSVRLLWRCTRVHGNVGRYGAIPAPSPDAVFLQFWVFQLDRDRAPAAIRIRLRVVTEEIEVGEIFPD